MIVAPATARHHRRLRRRAVHRPVDERRCWPPGRRCSSARRCTPRCGSTRRSSTTWPRCAGAACTSSSPPSGASPAATSAPAAWPIPPTSSPPPSASSIRARRTSPALRVVVTAGGTREPIDAVRVIANRSSGKQGYAIAAEAAARGAEVVLRQHRRAAASRPASASRPSRRRPQLQARRRAPHADADVIVMAAAVADFRPKLAAAGKIKKDEGVPEIVLEPTPDILAGLGAAQAARAGARRLRRRDRRPPRQRRSPSCVAKRLDLIVGQRRQRPGRRVRPRHQRRHAAAPGSRARSPSACRDKRAIARAVLDAVVEMRSADRDLHHRHPPPRTRSIPCPVGPSPPRASPRAIPTRWPTRSATPCSTPSSPRTRTAASPARRC